MEEIWKPIDGYYGYEVSDQGNIRSHWRKKHKESGYGCDWVYDEKTNPIKASDDGNGYQKVMLYDRENSRRSCKKVHRLVAEAFVAGRDNVNNTVDHIKSGREGKLDNRASNLRWISRRENIQKAYADGMCDERIRMSRKMLLVHDEFTKDELYFPSIEEASYRLGIERSTISHNIHDARPYLIRGRYWIELIEGDERLYYDDEYYSQQFSRI